MTRAADDGRSARHEFLCKVVWRSLGPSFARRLPRVVEAGDRVPMIASERGSSRR